MSASVKSVTTDAAAGEWTMLRDRAKATMEQAYAPYSGFRVGAAILGADGSVTVGCNVENASYPAGICAERSAVGTAIAHGVREFLALVIVTEAVVPTPPCGMCRQVLEEFAPQLAVMSVTIDGAEARWSMAELLPSAFTPASLEHR